MSLTGDPDGPPYRAGISVFDVMAGNHAVIGILAALRHRDATGAGPARRGQPAVLGAVRAGQPQLGLRRGRRGALPDGQRAPERLPVRAAARPRTGDLIVAAGQRPAVPQAVRGARHPRGRRRPAVRPQRRPHRQPRGAAADPRRAAGHARRRRSGSSCWSTRACRAGRSTRSTAGFAMAERARARPGRRGRRGRAGACRSARHPITFSATPARYALPPPELDEHGAELRNWLRPARTRRRRRTRVAEQPSYPTALGASTRTTITLLGQDLARGRDGQGRVRRAGVLAGHAARARPRGRCGCSRPCSPRWPTTASPRPRSSPG